MILITKLGQQLLTLNCKIIINDGGFLNIKVISNFVLQFNTMRGNNPSCSVQKSALWKSTLNDE